MDYNELKQKTLAIIKRAAETKTNIIRIKLSDVGNIYFYSNENNSCEFQELTNPKYGMELCAAIYQGMTEVSDIQFIPTQPQKAVLMQSLELPENVVRVDIKTYPSAQGFDMLLFLRYEWSIDSNDEEIATDLAIKAVQQLNTPLYVLNSVLDISKPETLHNFEKLKSLLMMAYNEGLTKGEKLGLSNLTKI